MPAKPHASANAKTGDQDDFSLETQQVPDTPSKPPKPISRKTKLAPRNSRATGDDAQILSYRHADKRVNNPEVGMVTPATDPEAGKTKWAYDPHLDPALSFDPQRSQIETLIDDALASGDTAQMRAALEELKRLQSPYLNWAGKAERTSFDIDIVSLHVHERIDPASILTAVRKAMGTKTTSKQATKAVQPGLFDAPFESLPLRDAIDFYRHERGWANRWISGDSLLVMNSLLQKENMAGRVQMIYIDPPYGIKYGSNFQPFVGKRDVKDRKDEDLTQEPEMIKAFRDTWELGVHSYLTYLRDRLLLARELLNETGSVFVQISDENVHLIRNLLDETFGTANFAGEIVFTKTSGLGSELLSRTKDYIIWYARDIKKVKFRQVHTNKSEKAKEDSHYSISDDHKLYTLSDLSGQFSNTPSCLFLFKHQGIEYQASKGRQWKTTLSGITRLYKSSRIATMGQSLRYIRYLDDSPAMPINDVWNDIGGSVQSRNDPKIYVVQTGTSAIERCILMTTDPGDLVLDPTCGSGTTAFVAEKWGRRWITCDTSRVAVTLAKQRLMTASYDYYDLKYPQEGLKGGFIYKTVPHITLKSIANNPEIDTIYEQKHPAIESALEKLNQALQHAKAPAFTVTEGGRKGQTLDFSKGDTLLEWEVPFDYPKTGQPTRRMPWQPFTHAGRRCKPKWTPASPHMPTRKRSTTNRPLRETNYASPAPLR